MARAIVGNRAINYCTIKYCARRPILRSIVATDRSSIVTTGDRWYDQSLHPAIDRTSNRGMLHVTDHTSTRVILWPSVRSIVTPDTDRTINRAVLRSIARSIVASCDRSLVSMTDRTINRGTKRPIVRSIVASCDYRSAIIRNWWCHHARLVVRSRKTYLRPLTILKSQGLEVLNMTIDLVTTHFALAITHDLCDQSYGLSTTCTRFQHFSVAGRS